MKKVVGFVSAMLVAASLFAGGKSDAKDAGSLVVYGSCEEEYLAAVCAKFQEVSGVTTSYQRL